MASPSQSTICHLICSKYQQSKPIVQVDKEIQHNFRVSPVSISAFITTLADIHLNVDETMQLSLSDGSAWNVEEVCLENWNIDDEIRVKYDTDDHRVFLMNTTTRSILPANLDHTSDSQYTIKAIDDKGYFIFIEDQYQWCIRYLGSFTSCGWSKGDRIIINKSDYSSARDYCLINIESQDHVRANLISWK